MSKESILRDLIDDFMRSDEDVRDSQVAEWRKNELYWKGCQDLYWDAEKRDWQYADETQGLITVSLAEGEEVEIDPTDFGKVVNIIKGHGEAVVAALATSVPTVRWFPADSDDPMDSMAARTFSKIEQIIRRHNEAELLIVRMAFLMWKQGMVAVYNDYLQDAEFGTIERQVIEMQDRQMTQRSCPLCGEYLETVPQENTSSSPGKCPNCNENYEQTDDVQEVESVPTVTSKYDENKGREVIAVFGPLNVRVPHYVTRLKEAAYLILETDHHISFAKAIYPNVAKKFTAETDTEKYDRWARQSHRVEGQVPNIVTIRRCWLRPWAFNMIVDEDQRKMLEEEYPKGCCAIFVNEVLADVYEEEMDKHWTISASPTSEEIHDEALCRPLMPLQDLDNEMTNLTVQTIEYGIGETFFDPKVLDPETYKKARQMPGLLYPIKAAAPNLPLDKSFHQLRGATLSREVDNFSNRLEQRQQFVVGSFPSIYGGPGEGGSETLGEYRESRIQALQRLSIVWKTLVVTWTRMMDKAVRDFVDSITDDERFVDEQGSGTINIWIRRAELAGKVGEARPEASETFPVSWQERQDRLYQLLSLNNEQINAALFHSENVGRVAELLGFKDFHIPGQKDRQKQLTEIGIMIQGQMIPPEPEVDMHSVHIEACVAWMISDTGQDLRMSTPKAYEMVKQHMMMHKMIVMQQQQQQGEGQASVSMGEEALSEEPI